MKLVKTTCELRHNMSKFIAAYEGVYRDMIGKDPEIKDWPLPGLRHDNKEKKIVFAIEPNKSAIDVEQAPNPSHSLALITRFFNSVNDRFGLDNILRHGLRNTWIFEFEGSFDNLLNLYKQRIFSNFDLINASSDVGAVFDFKKGNQTTNITIGPMEMKQLRSQFLAFDLNDVRSPFLYVSVDVGDTSVIKYSSSFLSQYVDSAEKESERLAIQVANQIGVK